MKINDRFVAVAALCALLLAATQQNLFAGNDDPLHAGSLKAGDKAPLFELPNAAGRTVKLADLLQKGPVVVFFYRGLWCPFCNKAMSKMAAALPEIRALGASVVAISPQLPQFTTETKEKLNLDYEVLSDVGLLTARQYGINFTLTDDTVALYKKYNIDLPKSNGGSTWELPVPGYYVIDQQGIIRWAYANDDYKVRPEPAEVIATLKKMLGK